MDNIEILNAVVGANENNKCKNTIGFFVEEEREGDTNKLLDEFIVEKPIVQFAEFTDGADDEYYSVEFLFNSKRDEDLRQQWQFLDRYVARFIKAINNSEKLPLLSVSFVPINFGGKYSILAKSALPDTIVKNEYAGDNSASIRMLFYKENVLFLSHDDDIIDKQTLEDEVVREIDDDLAREYPDVK